MTNEFEQLYESLITTLKQTKIMRYPRQIQLSEEFLKALSKEVNKHMDILDESQQPIRDLPEKFLKALQFELKEITEGKNKNPNQLKYRPRQKWEINPRTRIHDKPGYNRAEQNKKWKKETEQQID